MDIDDPYVDGLSITYGNSPARKHLWTYAAGASENGNDKALVFVLLEAGHSHLPLWGTITTVNLGLYIQLNNSCTLTTLSGMVTVVSPVTPAATHQTCHGLTERSTHHPLLTSNCACVEMKYVATNEDVSVEQFELYVN